MKELLYTHCSWCLRSMEGIEEGEAFALAHPLSDQLKARARRSSTSHFIPLAGKEIPTLILGSGDAAKVQWVLCRQECSEALSRALEEELTLSSATQFAEQQPNFVKPEPEQHSSFARPEPAPEMGMRHPLTLSIDADLAELIKTQAVRENRDLTDITEELYRNYLTRGYVPDLASELLRD